MTQQQIGQEIGSDLCGIFAKQNEDGSVFYTNAEAFDALVFIVLQTGMKLSKLPPALDGVMTRFFDQLKITGDSTSDQIAKAINGHFEKNPVNPQLILDLKRFS